MSPLRPKLCWPIARRCRMTTFDIGVALCPAADAIQEVPGVSRVADRSLSARRLDPLVEACPIRSVRAGGRAASESETVRKACICGRFVAFDYRRDTACRGAVKLEHRSLRSPPQPPWHRVA